MLEKSEQIKELAGALVKFQNEVEGVTKDGNNPFFKSKYATFGNIIDTIRTPMVKHGLSFSQMPSGESELTTVLMHTSGEYLASTVKMTPKDSTPQGQGSAITYMKRYALAAVLGISTDEDDDGNAASRQPYYDKSEVAEDAPIVVAGADEVTPAPKKTIKAPKVVEEVRAAKKEIKDLADAITINPLFKGEYEGWVKAQTGLDLVEANYPAIIKKLTSIQNGEANEE